MVYNQKKPTEERKQELEQKLIKEKKNAVHKVNENKSLFFKEINKSDKAQIC